MDRIVSHISDIEFVTTKPTTMWLKNSESIPHTYMDAFQDESSNRCSVTKVSVKHVLEASMYVFTDSAGG